MSYDLALFQVPDGMDAETVYNAIMESEDADSGDSRLVPTQSSAVEMRRIADVLKAWRPSLQEATPAKPLPWIELNEETLQLQFVVYETYVDVTMPFFRDRAVEMIECAFGALDALCAVADYTAFDPQLGRAVSSEDAAELLAIYRETDSVLPEIAAGQPDRKPWWKVW